MSKLLRAVIDVGTNSVKVLVADVHDGRVNPVFESSRQTRLGQTFYATRRLSPEAIARTAEAVAEFAQAARRHGADPIRVIATSAAREARNAGELTAAIGQSAGLPVTILSGEQEADLVFHGATTDPELGTQPLLLLDVGGGSTEFILGRAHCKRFSASFPLGSVRLVEILPHSDPPRPEELQTCRDWITKFLQAHVQDQLELAMRQELQSSGSDQTQTSSPTGFRLVGTGGTATILACMEAQLTAYNREKIEATRLSRQRVQWHVERLWSLPLVERQKIVGLPPNRADIILAGATIYETVMGRFGFDELRVSTRGLRFAAVMADS